MQRSEIGDANVEVVARSGRLLFGPGSGGEGDFAPDFVFHFVNPQLPDLAGDYRGLDEVHALFAELRARSDTGFHSEPRSLTPYGDEFVVAFATHTTGFGGAEFEVDAIVVWRVVAGRIEEVFDIPAVNTVRFP